MEEAEHSRYVSQLRAEFDSCDTTATGFLDRDELTVLCRKLQLDAHLPLLLDTLLGQRTYGRVNFDEFKEGFVAVLSHSLDFSASEDDSSYLEPVVLEEVKPKFVKGAKRYGRRSRPDSQPDDAVAHDSHDSLPSRTEATDSSLGGVRRAKLRRSTSLESVESLKSDEEPGSQKENIPSDLQCKGDQQEAVEGGDVCLQQPNTEELLQNPDHRVSICDFSKLLRGSAPVSCSTPFRSADLQRALHRPQVAAATEERLVRSTRPSLLTATVGPRVLSRLDDGSGCSSPERLIALWTEEGIRNSRDILQALDFSLEERLSLADLTLALDNELLVSGNGIHQAAVISYKNEIQHLHVLVEQACRERDKVRSDLEAADQRNLQLVREVDEHQASMESLNQSRIRDLEQDFRDRLTALRSQTEQESEALLQQVECERGGLQEELRLLRMQEAGLQEELRAAAQESRRLEEELAVVKVRLVEAESSVTRLQRDLDQLLHDKFGAAAALSHEERFSDIIKEYEQQCRDLQDRNDELSSEVELLKNQRSDRKSRRDAATLSWTEHQQVVIAEPDSDESDMKRSSSPLSRKKLQPVDKTALSSLDGVSGPAVSIQTELALEQLKQKHNQELKELHIQLETQVNYYERRLELMRQSMEVERKDISQAFKLEISELEEQKVQAEQQVKHLKEVLDKVQSQQVAAAGWGSEQERRMQRERAELEQNFAREIGNLVQRLSAEKDQLEAELRLKMDQEVMLVRQEAEHQITNMKLLHDEGQRLLLLQQRGFWEKQLSQSEREKLRREKSVGEELDRISSEKKRMDEEHKEEVSRLQEVIQTSQLTISQSESSLEEAKERLLLVEDKLTASQQRCSELEARLMEACLQLEESITFLESQELLNQRLTSQKSSMEVELQLLQTQEEQLVLQVAQLKEELGSIQAASDSLLQDRKVVVHSCSRLSDAFALQQAQLRGQEQTVDALRAELEALQEAARSRAAELDSLRTDRERLIQDLKEQATAVDTLQLELDAVSEEANRRSNVEEALKEEQSRSSQLQVCLDEEKEEVCRLSQEKGSYSRLADQLSTQIVEMEEEISSLRNHLKEVSSQLNGTADLVLDLRRQLNSRNSEVERLHASSQELLGNLQQVSGRLEKKDGELVRTRLQLLQLQETLLDSQNQLRSTEQDSEEEKKRMTRQLMELETLVLALEEETHPGGPHRTQLEEVHLENGALQERLKVLQQEVVTLEDDVAKKRRRLEEMEREHERNREEEERLHKENSRLREEVLDLSSRNLQVSNDNAELSARLHDNQESVRTLKERLATVSREQEEDGAARQRLQQEQATWEQERALLEAELISQQDKLCCLPKLEAELSSVTARLQRCEEDWMKGVREAKEQNNKVEKLHQALHSLEEEAELVRSQLSDVNQEKLSHTQEVSDLRRKLQDAEKKVEEMEAAVRKLMKEEEELHQALQEQEEQASVTLLEETHKLQLQNQELQQQLAELQLQSLELHNLTQEQQDLRSRLSEVDTRRMQAEEQAARAEAALTLARAQHVRQLQQLQETAGGDCREQLEALQARLQEEQRRSRQLEEALRHQAQQGSSQISMKQEQYDKTMSVLQHRMEELETKLKGVRMVLQEKVQQLKEQLAKNSQSSVLLKELYVENSQLVRALQVTEQRQKKAEKKNSLLEEKVNALNQLLRDVVHVSLAT